jgi:nucleoside-diphosphate-sugar epimerase
LKILVTGSSGMIGTRLCEKLIEKEIDFLGVDWRKNKWNETIDKKTFHFDLRDSLLFDSLPKDFNFVIHLAANARVYDLITEPSLARDNFESFFNVLEFCRKNKINNILFSSSREVYGNINKSILNEKDCIVDNCISPYAATKIANEALINSYHHCYGIDFTIFRFSNVYGMYDDSDRLIPKFIRQAQMNENLIIFGKEKIIDITYIDDTINGIIIAITDFENSKNKVFNVASGVGVPILKIAEMIISKQNSNSKIVIKENRTGEILQYTADISKANNILQYTPKIALEDGIIKSLTWYRNNNRKCMIN